MAVSVTAVKFYSQKNYSFTILSIQSGVLIKNPDYFSYEAAKLQSFKKDFLFGESDSDSYKKRPKQNTFNVFNLGIKWLVSKIEPTNDGVRGKLGISKMAVLSLFKQKNTEF